MNNISKEEFQQKLKEIQNNLSDEKIIELVTQLGSDEYKDNGNAIIFKTICHNIDSSEASLKLYYYKKNKMFHCYTQCGENFTIFELFKKRYELLGIKYNFIKDIVLKIENNLKISDLSFYQVYQSTFDKYQINKPQVNLKILPKQLLNIYTYYEIPEWIDDGISAAALKKFDILYSADTNRIIIPHFDINGNLIGIRGRALNKEDIEKGKYKPVAIEGKIMNHPLGYNLYGLNLVKNNIKKLGTAIIAEGEKSVLMAETFLGSNKNICVAACGSSISTYQIDLLCAAGAKKIIIAFDKEGKNWQEQEKYYKKLVNLCERFKNKAQMGFLYDTKNLLKLKESPFDEGYEVFIELYKGATFI